MWLPSANCTVQFNSISVTPPPQCQSNLKWKRHLLNSGLRFCHCKGRNPKLWPTQKHTVTDRRRQQAALIRSFPFELTLLRPFSKEDTAEVQRHKRWKHEHVKKKCFKTSILPWVFALSYMLLYDVNISVLCKDIHRLRRLSPQNAEITQWQIRVSVLQAVLRTSCWLVQIS